MFHVNHSCRARVNPPSAASRQFADLVPFPALSPAADALDPSSPRWDSLIGSAACASVHTHVAAHGYGLPDGAPALCEPPGRIYAGPDLTLPIRHQPHSFNSLPKGGPLLHSASGHCQR